MVAAARAETAGLLIHVARTVQAALAGRMLIWRCTMTKRGRVTVLAAATALVLLVGGAALVVVQVRGELSRLMDDDPAVWEPVIQAFEARDLAAPPPAEAVVFVGSSTIRLWARLREDMAPIPVIRRGFGGARIGDVVHFADRIVTPYEPAAVVVFAGSNDLAGFGSDLSPTGILGGYEAFVEAVHAAVTDVPIFYLSITPTRLRWKQWPLVEETNELIRAYSAGDDRLHFIDATHLFLTEEGRPDSRLFRFDRLHPNRRGYEALTSAIRPVLEEEYRRARPGFLGHFGPGPDRGRDLATPP
jgi:lysophospholipase L1-like esterase